VRERPAWGRVAASPQLALTWGLTARSSRFDPSHPHRANITRFGLACEKEAAIMATETIVRRGVVLLLLSVIVGSATPGDCSIFLND